MVQENESDEQKVDQDVMSEVRDELTGATNLTENPEEIEETWIEVKRRARTQEPRQPEWVRKDRPMVRRRRPPWWYHQATKLMKS